MKHIKSMKVLQALRERGKSVFIVHKLPRRMNKRVYITRIRTLVHNINPPAKAGGCWVPHRLASNAHAISSLKTIMLQFHP